jgi:hypothetical protein
MAGEYCPDCGERLHQCQAAQEADPVAELAHAEVKAAKTYTDAEVEVARLQAERDVEIARISAGIVRDEVVVEAVVAEAEAEAVADALAPPEEEGESPDVVIIADADAEAEPEEEESLPVAEEQGSEPVTVGSKSKNPWW